MSLTPQQCAFFESFGYIVLPGLMTEDIPWIIEEHRKVFENKGIIHDGSRRSQIVPFSDQSERLCTLLDHPRVLGVLTSLLGEDFNYIGGDGNYYSGDTNWHSDGFHTVGLYAKFHLYLDLLTRGTGCIRVIPGSHLGGAWRTQVERARQSNEDLAIPGKEFPCAAVETEPGDIVVFNHNIFHASYGGGTARRHFCLNVSSRAKTDAEIEELHKYIRRPDGLPRYHPRSASVHSELMRRTASSARMCHLEQVIDCENQWLMTKKDSYK